LITERDMAFAAAPAVYTPPPLIAPVAQTVPFTERLLLLVLFVTVLASAVAFIEPSPHDAMIGVLAVAAVVAGVRFDRTLVLPLLFLLMWNVSGLMSVTNVLSEEKTAQYAITSVYLAIAAMLFACIFARNTMPRLTMLWVAYTMSAMIAAFAGICGYFHLFPGADAFTLYGRAMGTFKDPNVYGPFLIWPALITIDRLLTRRIGVIDLAALAVIMFGLLLSFSRGAWFHFVLSALVSVGLAFLTAPSREVRLRIITLAAVSLGALTVVLVILLSFSSIGRMFQERAHLIQSYDVGQGGRFRLQELAVTAVLNFPNGLGPFEFARINGLQQHNVYLQAFLVYGWTGGMSYVLLLLTTMYVGLRTAMVRTPWQPYLITALGAFVGEVAEGFIIDTDHWRHFFLLLGMVWGLAAATFRQAREAQGSVGLTFLPGTPQEGCAAKDASL
jgi:hypothetical protein